MMEKTNWLKVWAAQIRAPFLLLAVVLVLIGGAVALHDGVFNGLHFALCMIGAVLAHVAVNMFNEVSDDKTGIDFSTRRTPFSGGSGTLQAGQLKRRTVYITTVVILLVALAIGIYLSWQSGWELMILVSLGGLATVFYTSHLTRWMVGELVAGMTLGSFVVLGTYFAQAGTLTVPLIWLSIPPGILTALLLLLNEFPDLEADLVGGRKHLLIVLGRRKAAVLYTVFLFLSYIILAAGVIADWFPVWVLISLATLPLAFKVSITAIKHNQEFEKMIPALGANVGVVLGTDLLIAVAYFVV